MSAITEPTRAAGDKVSVDSPKHPGEWQITAVDGTGDDATYTLKPASGQQRGIKNCPAWMLNDAPDEHGMIPYRPTVFFDPGQIVTTRFADAKLTGKLFAVIADKQGSTGNVNVAELGGAGGHYYKLPPRSLTVLTKAEIARALLLDMYEHADWSADVGHAISVVRDALADLDEDAESGVAERFK